MPTPTPTNEPRNENQNHKDPNQKGARLTELVEIMRRLLAESGCPWDREQTLRTLRPYLLEETYEVLEAIDRDDVPGHRDELGDLLFQIVFQSALRDAEGAFDIDDVSGAIVAKMTRRHPHVFGDATVSGADEVLRNWSKLKEKEHADKGTPRRTLDGVPAALPALLRAQRIGEKAATVGFDWPDVQGVRDKVTEELRELDEAILSGDPHAIQHEMGDLLMVLSRLSTHLHVAPEDALRAALSRFEGRFAAVEDLAAAEGRSVQKMSAADLEVYWQQVKQNQREGELPKK